MSTGLVHLPADFDQRCATYLAQLKAAFPTMRPNADQLRRFRAEQQPRLEAVDAAQVEAVFLAEIGDGERLLRRIWYEALLAVAYQTGECNRGLLRELEGRLMTYTTFEPGEREAYEQDFQRRLAGHNADASTSVISARAIHMLAMGKMEHIRCLLFLEATLDGLHIVTVQPQPSGGLVIVAERSGVVAWPKLLPQGLPTEPGLRALMLAGGLALRTDQPTDLKDALSASLREHLLDYLPSVQPQATGYLLLQRSYGWQIHELLAETMHKHLRLHPARAILRPQSILTLEQEVRALLINAPLRHAYSLLVASLDRTTKNVQLLAVPLFRREHTRAKGTVQKVAIIAADYTHQMPVIAVVAQPDERLETAQLLASWTIDLPPHQHCTLQFELEQPGVIRLTSPVPTQPSTETLNDLLGSVPKRMDRPTNRFVDLVVLMDTIGVKTTLDERCAYVKQLTEALQERLGAHTTLRMGLLAYGDHNHLTSRRTAEHPPVLRRLPLADPKSINGMLKDLVPVQGQDFEVALEDALAALGDLNWSPQSRRVVLTIGSRPPHPYRPAPGCRQVGSPSGRDWQQSIAEQRGRKTLSIAMLCPIAWPITDPRTGTVRLPSASDPPRLPPHALPYAIACWREIGYTALLSFSETPSATAAEVIAEAIAAGTAQLRLPLLAGV